MFRRKCLLALGVLLVVGAGALSAGQEEFAPAKPQFPRFSLMLMGGLPQGKPLPATSAYHDSWDWLMLDSVTESGTFGHDIKPGAGFSVAAQYLIAGGFGIQLRMDMNGKAQVKDQNSNYHLAWEWSSGSSYTRDLNWASNGSSTMSVFSFNLVYQHQSRMFRPYANAGVSYFSGKTELSGSMGYAVSWTSWIFQYFDWAVLPTRLEADLKGVGFNVGAGLNLMFHRNIGVSLGAAYFIKSPVKANWTVVPGTYTCENRDYVTLTLDSDAAADIAESIDQVTIKPSFLKLHFGIVFSF